MSTATLERPALGVAPTPPPPVAIGPTWQHVPGWVPGDERYPFILPEHSLGWQAQAWVEGVKQGGPNGEDIPWNINHLEETDEFGEPLPFKLTNEQLRFLLWFYAIDEHGRFTFRDIVFQRLKGHGKDPLSAIISAIEFVGPCRFSHWSQVDRPELGLRAGDPVAKEHPRAWVQLAAVSKTQTQNTMMLFPGLFAKHTMDRHGIDMGKEQITAHGGRRKIQAVTRNPRTLEGGRPTLVIKNETHLWFEANDGHAMAEVIDRNVAKAPGGQARTLSITNAYNPGQDSVGQQERESWEEELASGWKMQTLYDSLEAAENAYLRLPPILVRDGATAEEREYREATEEETRAYIGEVLDKVRGDSWWLDIDSLVSKILQPKSKVVESRRFYYNQVLAAEDSWVHPDAIRSAVDPDVAAMRSIMSSDPLRVGWAPVGRDEPIVLFFDGSKSNDATAIIGCRISDGYTFLVGVWQKPKGQRGNGWIVSRAAVDERVAEAHARFTVVAFFADPSHALDDEDDGAFWDGTIDDWHQRYHPQYTIWATKSAYNSHSIMWDMSSPAHQEQFVRAAERFTSEMERRNDIEEYESSFKIDGHPAFISHLQNARAYEHPTVRGITLHKGSRTSKRKIDLAVAAVGARMVRRLILNLKEEEQKPERTGVVW